VGASGAHRGLDREVLVRDDGSVKSAADLRRRRVGMLDLHSPTAAVGVRWLREQGLAEAVEIAPIPSISSALFALARDDVAAVVAAASPLVGPPARTPTGQRALALLPDIPGPWHVARPGVPAATLARRRATLFAFVPDPQRPQTAPNSRLTPRTVADAAIVEASAAFLRGQLATRRWAGAARSGDGSA
jgi:hypothetical protein